LAQLRVLLLLVRFYPLQAGQARLPPRREQVAQELPQPPYAARLLSLAGLAVQVVQTSFLAAARLDPHTEPAAQVVAQLETRLVAVAVASAAALVVEATLAAVGAAVAVELDSLEETG
tara:strand:+ start:204 stop:557 length:354 start_codon:yes stop_codon:yes gene_type:complete